MSKHHYKVELRIAKSGTYGDKSYSYTGIVSAENLADVLELAKEIQRIAESGFATVAAQDLIEES